MNSLKGTDNKAKNNRLFDYYSLFNTDLDITIRVFSVIAIAGTIGNTLGFAANLLLYGMNFITAFCAVCDILMIANLFYGLRSKHSKLFGYLMLFILDILEFPLLTLAYGAVMYPYLMIGFLAVAMISRKNKRLMNCILLGAFDAGIVVYSNLNPYLFGPQDPAGLLGSAVSAFVISIYAVTSLISMWQNVYLVETIDTDAITRSFSKIGFEKNVSRIIKSDDREYLLLYFNIKNFKVVNTIFGIEGGNRLLQEIAEHIASAPFEPRCLGRLNSDRYVCLVEKEKFDGEAISDFFEIRFEENGRSMPITLNCGVYEIVDRNMEVAEMCDRAYSSIRFIHPSGNRFLAFYDSTVDEVFTKELEILDEVEKAIHGNQFEAYYQPIVDCNTKKVVSAEALARWIHPEHGMIKPSIFIPVLEKKDLISDLDLIMANHARNLITTRRVEEKPMVPVSVNLSRLDLYNHKLMERLNEMLVVHDKSAGMYRFEVTESVYDEISDTVIGELTELRKLGAEILIDDFGSGFSSLGSITKYDFDIIKLDMQFVRNLDKSDRVESVVVSLIEMAHKLGAKVIAEGVETESQFEAVKKCGCDFVQGYYFYQPLDEREFLKLLDE